MDFCIFLDVMLPKFRLFSIIGNCEISYLFINSTASLIVELSFMEWRF
ncbi:hypothetical protein ES703_58134 [subsurface metagenome]